MAGPTLCGEAMLGATDPSSYSLAADMGAESEVAYEKLSIYLPDRDRLGNAVTDIQDWIDAGITMMTSVNGGVTQLPWCVGMWKSETGNTVAENTTVLYSFIRDPKQFYSKRVKFRDFLHDFGRETNQEEVAFEYMGDSGSGLKNYFYIIRNFDP